VDVTCVTSNTVGFDYASNLILGDERLLIFVQEDSSVDSGMRGTIEEQGNFDKWQSRLRKILIDIDLKEF